MDVAVRAGVATLSDTPHPHRTRTAPAPLPAALLDAPRPRRTRCTAERGAPAARARHTIEHREKEELMNVIATTDAPAAIGPYVQGRIAGGLLFASGQIALDPATGELVGATVQEQTEQVMRNVAALLAAAGTDFNHVVKATCFLANIDDFAAFNEVYARSFGEARPARSAVGVAGLPKGALVEVEVIAEVPEQA